LPLEDTANWFKAAKPEPTLANFYVQMGVHFEEVGEMIDELTPVNYTGDRLKEAARSAITNLANHFKNKGAEPFLILHENDRPQFFDAICDQLVTATGTAVLAGMDAPGGLAEVNRSNYSKFEDGKPVLLPNGKIGKGKDYSPPDLTPFV